MRGNFKIAFFIGFLAALVWIPVLRNLIDHFQNVLLLLLAIVPGISVAGLYVCEILSRRIKFLYQFAKYAIVGFFSAGIDLAIFNLLIYLTGVELGSEIILFKTISFSIAMLNSYNWNKIWTFELAEKGGGDWHSHKFFRFIIITMFGLILNVSSTSLIIGFIHPPFDFTQLLWNNMAAVMAIIINIIWNFVGYKIVVFKPRATNF